MNFSLPFLTSLQPCRQRAILLLAALPLLVTGCAYDHQARFIDAALHRPDGSMDTAALGGALGGKFFDKTPQEFIAFVEALGGTCGQPDQTGIRMKCTVSLSGASCIANALQLEVFLVKNRIGPIGARFDQSTC